MTLTQQILQLQPSNLIVAVLHYAIESGSTDDELAYFIQNQGKDAPDVMRQAIGAELFDQVENYVLCAY